MNKMNNYDKILKYMDENNGYITTGELLKLNVNKNFLSILVKRKRIQRIENGVYKLPDYPMDNFYVLSTRSKHMCYSHSTALYLHNMCDRVPLVYDVTVPYNYSGSLLKDSNVSLKYVKNELLELGMIKIKTINNLEVKCYDVERTICDIIKDKNNMDKEIYSKALKEYAKSKNKDILKLIKYAKKLNIEKEVIESMEVIL